MAKTKKVTKKKKEDIIIKEPKVNIWKIFTTFFDLATNKNSTLKQYKEIFWDNLPESEYSFAFYYISKCLIYNNVSKYEIARLIKISGELNIEIFLKTVFLYIRNNNLYFPKFMQFYNFNKNYDTLIQELYPNIKKEEYEMFCQKYNNYSSKELYTILSNYLT